VAFDGFVPLPYAMKLAPSAPLMIVDHMSAEGLCPLSVPAQRTTLPL
jgi:hypothetical protein